MRTLKKLPLIGASAVIAWGVAIAAVTVANHVSPFTVRTEAVATVAPPTIVNVSYETFKDGLPEAQALLSREWVRAECDGNRHCRAGVLLAYLVQPSGFEGMNGPFSIRHDSPITTAVWFEGANSDGVDGSSPVIDAGPITVSVDHDGERIQVARLSLFERELDLEAPQEMEGPRVFSYRADWRLNGEVADRFADAVFREYRDFRAERKEAQQAERKAEKRRKARALADDRAKVREALGL